MMGGFWGLWAAGFFDNEFGLFYGHPDKGRYFGYELCGSVVIWGWTSAFAIVYFMIMKLLKLLRVSKVQEVVGLDVTELGGFSSEDYEKIY
jgi:ammonia channel protein AmtB